MAVSSPKFFLITGPPAVGKMSVGQALAQRMDYVLFHNHHSIEFALSFFSFGSPEFGALNEGIRQLMFRTAAESEQLKGFIFTLVWAFDRQDDWDYVADLKARFQEKGWEFYLLELFAPLEVRADRNEDPHRLAQKPSKQDPELRRKGLFGMEEKYQMNATPGQITEPNYLRIDNSVLSPEAVVDQIVAYFGLEEGEKDL
ncbi:MAG: AAA family ATPase [Bacteroidia bacterium]|nr:AAA family ATPase [Bacteroidia bacterium]